MHTWGKARKLKLSNRTFLLQNRGSKKKFLEKSCGGGGVRQLSNLPASPVLAPCFLTILEYSGSLKSIKHTPFTRVICIRSAKTHIFSPPSPPPPSHTAGPSASFKSLVKYPSLGKPSPVVFWNPSSCTPHFYSIEHPVWGFLFVFWWVFGILFCFLGASMCTCDIWRFPGQGQNQSCSCQPTQQPQQ